MEIYAMLDDLRDHGLYPALVDNRIRIYGDTSRFSSDLRDAITGNRTALIDALRRREQSIAYDLIDVARAAGWHPSITGPTLSWQHGNEQVENPMPTPALRDALNQHVDDVIRVIRNVPAGCRRPDICRRRGICPSEIRESGCWLRAKSEPPSIGDAAAKRL